MMTFKQFIMEAIAYKPEPKSGPFPRKWRYFENIDGKQVEVHITHDKDPKMKQWDKHPEWADHHEVSYDINDSYRRRTKIPSSTKRKILRYVHNTIKQHVERTKPKAIRLIGDTDRKTEFYGKYAPHLAKETGGIYKPGRGVLRWKKNNVPVDAEHFVVYDREKPKT